MHLTIINGAARTQTKSNTAKIINAFCKGFQEEGHTVEIWYLSDRKQWDKAKNAFMQNTDIMYALPLYVESIPGIMLEFLEGFNPKVQPETKISFIVQGGFPEASQSRCCEKFLKTLPDKLNCQYGGTLIRGDMFGIGLLGKMGEKMVAPFQEVGSLFAHYGYFEEHMIVKYSSPEYLSKKQIRQSEKWGKHIQKCFMNIIARRQGCMEQLDARPYRTDKNMKGNKINE